MAPRPTAVAGLLAIAVLFFIANSGAYGGFFDGDDLDNMTWSRIMDLPVFFKGLSNPFPNTPGSFRAIGQVMYIAISRGGEISFPPYIAWIHAVHLLTALTVFLLLRNLNCTLPGALAGTLFFALNPASFEIYWKPMYVFDLTAGLFCALALLAWTRGRWIVALVCFWFAIKSKENAIMLPFVLIAYEWLLGQRRWKPLLPFVAITATLVLRAMWTNQGSPSDYRFQFSLAALLTTGSFYASSLFRIPLAGVGVLGVPFLTSDRRAWFGFATFLFILAPMLFLPGRLYSAYLYTSLIGLSIVAAALLTKPSTIAVFLCVWIPWTAFARQREQRELIIGQRENERYTQSLAAYIRRQGTSAAYICDGYPGALHSWGAIAVARLLSPPAQIHLSGDTTWKAPPDTTVLRWDEASKKLYILPYLAPRVP